MTDLGWVFDCMGHDKSKIHFSLKFRRFVNLKIHFCVHPAICCLIILTNQARIFYKLCVTCKMIQWWWGLSWWGLVRCPGIGGEGSFAKGFNFAWILRFVEVFAVDDPNGCSKLATARNGQHFSLKCALSQNSTEDVLFNIWNIPTSYDKTGDLLCKI